MIRDIRRQCRRALTETGPAVVGAAALATFALLARSHSGGAGGVGGAGGAPPAAAWPREVAPLVVALVACGPVAAARAAELARMRMRHQVDALRAMGGSVWWHVVTPRLLAAALALPLLVLIADATGLGVTSLDWVLDGVPGARGWTSADGVAPADIASGLARAALFGALLASISCIAGLTPPRVRRDGRRRSPSRTVARAAARAGAGGAVAVLGLHVLLGGSWPW